MSKLPNALKLAEELESSNHGLGNRNPMVMRLDCCAELRRQHALIEELTQAVRNVLAHRHDTPTTGYLRDTGASRDALAALAAALAKAEAQL